VAALRPAQAPIGRRLPLKYRDGDPITGNYFVEVADWDGDGDWDLFCGGGYTIKYFENVGTNDAPSFKDAQEVLIYGRRIGMSYHVVVPTVTDWDVDGRNDLLFSMDSGWIHLVRRPAFGRTRPPRATVYALEER